MEHNVIKTYTGKYVNVTAPTVDKICIEDIAHALSVIPRYNGHYPRILTVAEHCLNVVKQVEKRSDCTPRMKMHALLHDASEAYLCDLPRPIKKAMKGYWGFEQEFMDVIFKKYGVDESEYLEIIDAADTAVFDTEWAVWTHWDENRTHGKTRADIKKDFLETFYSIAQTMKYDK